MTKEAKHRVGQFAKSPTSFSLRAWWQIAMRLKDRIPSDNLSIVAAGVAFYGFLAVFPMIGAIMTVFGLLTDPAAAAAQMAPFEQIVPAEAYELLMKQVTDVTSAAENKLSMGLLFSLLLTIWSATKGVKALITALNIAYEEKEARGFIQLNILALAMTVGAIVFVIFSLGVIALIPAIVKFIAFGNTLETLVLWVRWPVIAVLVMAVLAFLYRFAPHRRDARLEWITPGAILATLLWLALSALFSFYVSNFGNYDETFGSLGAVVVLLFWFYLSAFVICIGAELNAEMELQTKCDSTVGAARPAGERGAYVADNTAPKSTNKTELEDA